MHFAEGTEWADDGVGMCPPVEPSLAEGTLLSHLMGQKVFGWGEMGGGGEGGREVVPYGAVCPNG